MTRAGEATDSSYKRGKTVRAGKEQGSSAREREKVGVVSRRRPRALSPTADGKREAAITPVESEEGFSRVKGKGSPSPPFAWTRPRPSPPLQDKIF
eukprot:scaffold68803_cov23-Tisochrysis_lutea.AAC.1